MTHLPEVYRVPVLLRDINGLSTEEASAILKVKPQTLKSRLHRGRLILRKHMGEFSGRASSFTPIASHGQLTWTCSVRPRPYRASTFSNAVRSCRLNAGSSVFPTPPFTISTGTAAIMSRPVPVTSIAAKHV